jgi:hypothetical protein
MAPRLCWHISSIWVKIKLYTENQVSRLFGSGVKIGGGSKIGVTTTAQFFWGSTFLGGQKNFGRNFLFGICGVRQYFFTISIFLIFIIIFPSIF